MAKTVFVQADRYRWFCEELNKVGFISLPVDGDVVFEFVNDDGKPDCIRRKGWDYELRLANG